MRNSEIKRERAKKCEIRVRSSQNLGIEERESGEDDDSA